MMWECLSCNGKYSDTMPDGAIYAHVCPSEIRNRDGKLVVNPNPRNENRARSRHGLETGILAEGAGVKCLSDSSLKEPQWIAEMKARINQREATDAE